MKGFADDRDFRVLDPDLAYYTMETVYYDDSSAPYPWPYENPADLSSGHFSSDAIISSNFDPACTDAWHPLQYQQGSSPSSDQSSMDRAPSTNTSYNEADNMDLFPEPSSPQSPFFGMRTNSPTHMLPVIAPRFDNDLLFDLSGTPSVDVPRLSMTTEPVKCPDGCPRKTFGRQYELDRHIREQHRCPHENCADVRFSKPKEKREHERLHSETGLGYRCGTCLLSGLQVKTLARGEKLKKHFKDVHEVKDDFDFRDFQCLGELCYVSKTFGGIFFASQRELREHEKQEHSTISPRAPLGELRPDAFPTPLYEHFAAGSREKRPHGAVLCSDAKRGKTERVESAMTTTPQHASTTEYLEDELLSSPTIVTSSPQTIVQTEQSSSLGSSSEPWSLSAQPEQTFAISVVELHALTKHQSWNGLVEDLQALSLAPVFDSKEGAIKLRGSCAAKLDEGKKLLERLIESIRVRTSANADAGTMEQRSKPVSHQQASVRPQPEIHALDVKENADVLALWNTRLLPSFPVIVREALIEGSYSVSLVRQKILDSLYPVIRFRSSGNQSKASRQIVRESVKKICLENGSSKLHVQFTEGTLVRLAGGSLEASILDDPSYDHRFPHERRPWPNPGMSASIGPSNCPHVSATLGGYISVDNRIYMLTVDHFVSECLCSFSTDVRSPSSSDIGDVKVQLERKIEELSLRIREMAPNEIPLGQVEELLFARDVDEELEQYRRFERELDGGESQFAFATVRERCGNSQLLVRPSTNPRLPIPGACHRMDWSVSEVTTRRRMGKNVHRYGRVQEPTLSQLQAEVIRSGGLGPICTSTGEVVAGEQAYYIGTTSGLREGIINPALVQWRDEFGDITHEWALVVPDCEQLRDRDFQGDSGAWILGNDNQLLGLLWGWDNGNLLFTPIQDVFADIAEKMRVEPHLIKLPEYSSPRPRQGSLLCRRSKGVLRDISPHQPAQAIQLPVMAQELIPPSVSHEKRWRRRSSACSISSTPSLLSSSSSADDFFTGAYTPKGSAPPLLSATGGADMKALPIETRARVVPSDEAIEEWVYIHCDDDAIDEKLSALRLTPSIADASSPYAGP